MMFFKTKFFILINEKGLSIYMLLSTSGGA